MSLQYTDNSTIQKSKTWHLCGCCQLGNGDWVMDSTHKYFAQVRGQLGVTKIEECNLAIYIYNYWNTQYPN